MATKKNNTKKISVAPAPEEIKTAPEETTATPVSVPEEIKTVSEVKEIKYPVGSIVLLSKDVDADLNGFKLFPQYKKYTYTVEAYNEKTQVYTLRRLNLSLSLKETDLIAPSEKSNSALFNKQY